MRRLLSPISFKLIVLFSLTNLSLAAQEKDFLRDILKESLKSDFMLDPMISKPDSFSTQKQIILDVNKEPLYVGTFNRQLDSLFLNYDKFKKNISYPDTIWMISTMMMSYTNPKIHDPIDKLNGYIVPRPRPDERATLFMVPIAIALQALDYLAKKNVLPGEPFVPTVEKKTRTLKTITKDVYHIDDDD
jgi:hypothetical protein